MTLNNKNFLMKFKINRIHCVALHKAVINQNIEIIRLLLQQDGIDIDKKDNKITNYFIILMIYKTIYS